MHFSPPLNPLVEVCATMVCGNYAAGRCEDERAMRASFMPLHALTAVQIASAELQAVHVHGDPTCSRSSALDFLGA